MDLARWTLLKTIVFMSCWRSTNLISLWKQGFLGAIHVHAMLTINKPDIVMETRISWCSTCSRFTFWILVLSVFAQTKSILKHIFFFSLDILIHSKEFENGAGFSGCDELLGLRFRSEYDIYCGLLLLPVSPIVSYIPMRLIKMTVLTILLPRSILPDNFRSDRSRRMVNVDPIDPDVCFFAPNVQNCSFCGANDSCFSIHDW